MAHTFMEHIAGKVVQRIVLISDPDAHEIEIQFQTELDSTFNWSPNGRRRTVELRDWKRGQWQG